MGAWGPCVSGSEAVGLGLDLEELVGEVAGVYGIKGWIKVRSYTDPKDRILDYGPWLVAGNGTEPRSYRVREVVHPEGQLSGSSRDE